MRTSYFRPQMSNSNLKRILFAIPIPYSWGGFWTRDSGLIVLALRKKGYDARLIALGDNEEAFSEATPIVTARLGQLKDSAWWKAMNPDAVVLNTWGAPRYDGIRKAVLAVTTRVIERLDTDGVKSPRIWPTHYLGATFGSYIDSGKNPLIAAVMTFLRYQIVWNFPSLMDRRMVETMSQIPVLAAESPLAVARTSRFMRIFSNSPKRIVLLPHPVNEDTLNYDGGQKENKVISVARWNAHQKNAPVLLRTLKQFLELHSDWHADLVGGGMTSERVKKMFGSSNLHSRVTVHGIVDHGTLRGLYSRAKIFFLPSRHEANCVAAMEALCCGCSVVSASHLGASGYHAGKDSGTAAARGDKNQLLDALDAEVILWETGNRIAGEISSRWRAEAGADSIAKKVLDVLREI